MVLAPRSGTPPSSSPAERSWSRAQATKQALLGVVVGALLLPLRARPSADPPATALPAQTPSAHPAPTAPWSSQHGRRLHLPSEPPPPRSRREMDAGRGGDLARTGGRGRGGAEGRGRPFGPPGGSSGAVWWARSASARLACGARLPRRRSGSHGRSGSAVPRRVVPAAEGRRVGPAAPPQRLPLSAPGVWGRRGWKPPARRGLGAPGDAKAGWVMWGFRVFLREAQATEHWMLNSCDP